MFIYVDPWLSNQGDSKHPQNDISPERRARTGSRKRWLRPDMVKPKEVHGHLDQLCYFCTFEESFCKFKEISAGNIVSVPVRCCQVKWSSNFLQQYPRRVIHCRYRLCPSTTEEFLYWTSTLSRSNLYEVIPEIHATKQTIPDEYLSQGQTIPEFD